MGPTRVVECWNSVSAFLGDSLRSFRLLTVAVTALTVATASGCTSAPPPVSEKVQQYYDENSTKKPTFAAAAPTTKVAFVGDSYTAGAGSSPGQRWTTQLASSMGWTEENFGRGGTGYLATAGKEGCGLDVCPNYHQMLADAVKAKPSIVVVAGGRNDHHYELAAIDEAVRGFYADLRSALPKATILVINPLWDSTDAPSELAEIAAIVKVEAAKVGAKYVDIGQPLSGKQDLIGPDEVHPNNSGYTAIAAAVKAKIVAAKIPGISPA